MHRLIIAVAAVFLITSSAQANMSSRSVLNDGKIFAKTINKWGDLVAFVYLEEFLFKCYVNDKTVKCTLPKDTYVKEHQR